MSERLQPGGGIGLCGGVALAAAERPVSFAGCEQQRLPLRAWMARLRCRDEREFTLPLDPGQAPLRLCFEVEVRDRIPPCGAPQRLAAPVRLG